MSALEVASTAGLRAGLATPGVATPGLSAPEHGAELEPIGPFFERRAADVDAGAASVREGLAHLGRHGLADAALPEAIDSVARVARSDLASAFSAWAHRMVIDYVRSGPAGSPVRDHLPALAAAERLGATALAAGAAHVLAGLPLPVTYRSEGDDIVLDGRIPWASNLIPPFLVVTAAAEAERPARTVVVAFEDALEGIAVAPHPPLLALGATGSSTIGLSGVRVPRSSVLSEDVHAFVQGVLPRFLLLQSAFCKGLAERSLEEAGHALGDLGAGIRPRLDEAADGVAAAAERLNGLAQVAEADGAAIPASDLLGLRLRWSELAREAVHLELAAIGGRGYLSSSPTARRVREAAFLPVQAPTEVLLRWLLSRSA